MHDQDGGELAEHGEPAQPHERFKPHVLGPVLNSRQTKHAGNVATWLALSKQRSGVPQGCQAACSRLPSDLARVASINAISARSTSRTPSPLAAEMTKTSFSAARPS